MALNMDEAPLRAPSSVTRVALAAAVLLVAWLFAYLPDLGHGFIADDHRWIHESQIASVSDIARIFRSHVGFYRPLVALTFGLDSLAWGSNAFGYGLTNLAVLLADGALLFLLARRLALPRAAALWATAVWLFNFHAVNMALLWLSGRTALLATLFGLAATLVFLTPPGHRPSLSRLGTGVLALMAMLCKEEAVMLPFLFTAWRRVDRGHRGPEPAPATASPVWPAWVALTIYAALRLQSGAFGPTTAPAYYQFTFAVGGLLRNVVEYLDRGATLAGVLSLVLWLAAGRVLRFDPSEHRAIRLGLLWFAAWSAITVLLPVRSSLYALVPSIGTALCLGAIAAAAHRQAPLRLARVGIVMMVAALAAVPVYRSRNVRWVAPADLSTYVLATVKQATARQQATGGTVVLVENPTVSPRLREAFGSLFPDAVAMWIGQQWRGELVQSVPQDAADGTTLIFRLRDGTLTPLSR
jgi:hypothetical protein